MFKVKFLGDVSFFEAGLIHMASELKIEISADGFPIEIIKSNTQEIIASSDGKKGKIQYNTVASFYRLLNLWLSHHKKAAEFSLEEKTYFKKNGVMIDSSRNAVVSIAGMKKILRQMAKLGLNQAMLYTEDTYEVEEYPYFGYLRGRYSQEELKELDDYAYSLGIEMVPCIQTLAHLFLALKYEYARELRDTSDILLVGEEKTYEFLDHLIKAATTPFRTSKIHIGMDEAFGLGTGVYQQKNGLQDRFELMNQHLKRVVEITKKYDLKPMMWSDMFYRVGSKTSDYYDLESVIPNEIIKDIPDVDMVYWDYYHEDQKIYDTLIERHKKLHKKIIYAGGQWTWNGIAPNFGKAFETTKAGMASAKKHGLTEVFTTLWGDDGAETPVISTLPGLQFYADLCYRDSVEEEAMKYEFEYNTGYPFNQFYLLNALDETPGVMENNIKTSATSKFLLWQDPLLGYYDQIITDLDLNNYYKKLADDLRLVEAIEGDYQLLFSFYRQLADVLKEKAEFGLKLKNAYDLKDQTLLNKYHDQALTLAKEVDKLRLKHEAIWLEYNKPFGWEVLDIRYGGVQNRLKTTAKRLKDYLNHNIDQIEELEEKKLPYTGLFNPGAGFLARGLYKEMITPGKLSDV